MFNILSTAVARVHVLRDLCASESRVTLLRAPPPTKGGGQLEPHIPPGAVTCPTPFHYETTVLFPPKSRQEQEIRFLRSLFRTAKCWWRISLKFIAIAFSIQRKRLIVSELELLSRRSF